MIQADLDELKIPEKELENLSGIALSDGFAADFYRPATLGNGKKLFSILLNELLIFCVTLVVSLPVALLAINIMLVHLAMLRYLSGFYK